MAIRIYYPILFLCSTILINCCTKVDKPKRQNKSQSSNLEALDKKNIPPRIKKLNNLSAYSVDNQAPKTVELKKVTVFKSNENVLINGYTGDVAIDNENKVYIVGQKPGSARIYVFNADGNYLTKFTREGRGPGEFESIGSLSITKKRIYVFGPRLQKMSIFTIADLSLLKDVAIRKDRLNESKLISSMRVRNLYIMNDSTLFINLKSNIKSNEFGKKFLYKITEDGYILSPKILEGKTHRVYKTGMKRTSKGYVILPFSLPINRSSLITISDKGNIYTAWTEDFLIKVYDADGNYQRSIYYSYKNSSVDLSNLDISESRRQFLTNDNVPETWPALHNMIIDDEERLWVFTITDSDSTYKGWVLNRKGELMAKFDWPGKRSERTAGISPLFKVKNGNLYTRERDIREGIDQIVKYKINFVKR